MTRRGWVLEKPAAHQNRGDGCNRQHHRHQTGRQLQTRTETSETSKASEVERGPAALPALMHGVGHASLEPRRRWYNLVSRTDKHLLQQGVFVPHDFPSPRRFLSCPTARDSSLLTESSLACVIAATSATGRSRYQCRTSSRRLRCLSRRMALRRSAKALVESPPGAGGSSGCACLRTDHQRPRRTSRHSLATMPRNHGFISAPALSWRSFRHAF